jgi:hypothetical protein
MCFKEGGSTEDDKKTPSPLQNLILFSGFDVSYTVGKRVWFDLRV